MDFYWSDFTDLGADRKLRLSALQRRHFLRNPTKIDAFRGHVLIFGHFRKISSKKKRRFFDIFAVFFDSKTSIWSREDAESCQHVVSILFNPNKYRAIIASKYSLA